MTRELLTSRWIGRTSKGTTGAENERVRAVGAIYGAILVAIAPTATIRVPKQTRDDLAQIAANQGISISRLLTEFASREHIHAIFAAERAATKKDLSDPSTAAEYALWDQASSDDHD